MLFDPRETKQGPAPVETKSVGAYYPAFSFSEYLFNSGNGDLGAIAAIRLYMDVMPFFNAVDMRATAFAQLPIRLWDKKKEEYITEHPVLDLLAKPNADMTQTEFLEQVSSFLDITGNSFMVATGRTDKPPLELAAVPPQQITFGTGNKWGILHVPDTMWITNRVSGQQTFRSEEARDRGIIFVSDDDKQLWHIRNFNPLRSATFFWGMSRARPVMMELQQYQSGNNTNLSLLKRGTRLSMAWVNTRSEELTDKQWDRVQEEASKYSGDLNAGGTPVLDGMDIKPTQQSNRDMEFKDLQEAMLARVSTIYRIPLALLLSQSMTMNNLETALLQFFDASVIPHAEKIYSELTNFLLPRYPNSENLMFKMNENDITALKVRMIEQAKGLSVVGVNTTDEIRSTIGYEKLDEGGDKVMVNGTMVPLGTDMSTDEPTGDEVANPATNSKFRQLLTETKKYSEDEIDKIVKEHFR